MSFARLGISKLVVRGVATGVCGMALLAGCSNSASGVGASGGSSSTSGGSVSAEGGSAGASTTAGGHGGGLVATGGSGDGGAGLGGMSAGGSAGQGGAAPGPVGPRFIGRFDMTNPNAPIFEWSGTAISLRFKGTAIGVTLSDGASNVFEVILDGKHTVVPSIAGSNKYALGTGLSDGPHDLLLYRRTEAFFGDTTFGGFDIDPSAYLPGDPVPTRRLEVIGDSISAGYGDEGMNPCPFVPATENQYLSYEALAARSVGAELYTEAWSGIGMVSNSGGDTTNPRMPERYLETLPATDKTATWDFSKFIPDAVVINLGTNDFSKADPGMIFQTTYTTFVTDLRGHYPKARLFLAVGPMLGGDQYTAAKGYLNGVIAARASAGDKNLVLLEFGTQDGAQDGLGCDGHPTLATHQKMSVKLVAALKADLGW
ncbi:MAG TPA: SGNH/GDSL hydrolase family protein [Polyangiaceae bacterium]|nr:SGNH/GDSL hydrolase family protein [Polyangiaceae bacterium]